MKYGTKPCDHKPFSNFQKNFMLRLSSRNDEEIITALLGRRTRTVVRSCGLKYLPVLAKLCVFVNILHSCAKYKG